MSAGGLYPHLNLSAEFLYENPRIKKYTYICRRSTDRNFLAFWSQRIYNLPSIWAIKDLSRLSSTSGARTSISVCLYTTALIKKVILPTSGLVFSVFSHCTVSSSCFSLAQFIHLPSMRDLPMLYSVCCFYNDLSVMIWYRLQLMIMAPMCRHSLPMLRTIVNSLRFTISISRTHVKSPAWIFIYFTATVALRIWWATFNQRKSSSADSSVLISTRVRAG